MSRRSVFTSITPVPKGVSREAVVRWLHNHTQMIKLNPLVIRTERSTPPPHAPQDELDCAWYEITDQINYLPGGVAKGEVTYKACFHDLDNGVQTHVYAPAGLDIQEKWSVGGNEPGEPREVLELGSTAPREGLYIREDVNMRCNVFLTSFVKKNLSRAHKVVIERIGELANLRNGRDSGESAESDLSHPNSLDRNQSSRSTSRLSYSTPCYCVGEHLRSCHQYYTQQRPRQIQPASSEHPDDKPLPSLPESSGLHSHWHHIDISMIDADNLTPVEADKQRPKVDIPGSARSSLLPAREQQSNSRDGDGYFNKSDSPMQRNPVGSSQRPYIPISATLPVPADSWPRQGVPHKTSAESARQSASWDSGLH